MRLQGLFCTRTHWPPCCFPAVPLHLRHADAPFTGARGARVHGKGLAAQTGSRHGEGRHEPAFSTHLRPGISTLNCSYTPPTPALDCPHQLCQCPSLLSGALAIPALGSHPFPAPPMPLTPVRSPLLCQPWSVPHRLCLTPDLQLFQSWDPCLTALQMPLTPDRSPLLSPSPLLPSPFPAPPVPLTPDPQLFQSWVPPVTALQMPFTPDPQHPAIPVQRPLLNQGSMAHPKYSKVTCQDLLIVQFREEKLREELRVVSTTGHPELWATFPLSQFWGQPWNIRT